MLNNIYTMRDRKSGIYGNPFISYNDKCAIRDFDAFCNLPQNQYLADDMELYKLGQFDSASGEIVAYKPEFLKGGEVIETV